VTARLLAAMLMAVTSAACAAEFTTLDGDSLLLTEITSGRQVLLFAWVPGCPPCEEAARWLADAAETVEGLRPLVVAPEATPELRALAEELPGLTVILDEGWVLWDALDVWYAPTLLTLLDWQPQHALIEQFDSRDVATALRSLADTEGSLVDLLGAPAPEFVGRDLDGEEIVSGDLPLPHVLVFFSVRCPGCWYMAEASVEVTELAELVLLVAPGQLTEEHRARLEEIFTAAPGPWRVLEVDGAVPNAYQVRQTPTSFVVSSEGTVREVLLGTMRAGFWYEEVREVVEEEPGG